MWPGRGLKDKPGTKTALNVAGSGSEGTAGHKNGPKRGRGGIAWLLDINEHRYHKNLLQAQSYNRL